MEMKKKMMSKVVVCLVIAGMFAVSQGVFGAIKELPGWPKKLGGRCSQIILADMNKSGKPEIIVNTLDDDNNPKNGYKGTVHVFKPDGAELSGWPQSLNCATNSQIAAADLDGNGQPEIVITGKNGKMYVSGYDGELKSGWPVEMGFKTAWALSIANIDKDSNPEIIVLGNDKKLHAWKSNGTKVSGFGWATSADKGGNILIGDITGDNNLEIAVAGYYGGKVEIFSISGEVLPGWPQSVDDNQEGTLDLTSTLLAADIDGDGKNEIICGAYNGRVFVWHLDGKNAAGWPKLIFKGYLSNPGVIIDMDEDDDMEIVVASTVRRLTIFHHDGTFYVSNIWTDYAHAPAEVADADADGDIDVLVVGVSPEYFEIHLFDFPGAYVPEKIFK